MKHNIYMELTHISKRQVDNGELYFAECADGKPMKVVKGEVFYGKVSINKRNKKCGKDELPIVIDCMTDNPECIFCVINVNELAQLLIKKEIGWKYITGHSDGYRYISRCTSFRKPDNSDEDKLLKIEKPKLRKSHLLDDVKALVNNTFVKVVVDDVDDKKLKLSVVDVFDTEEEAEKDMIETLKK